MTFTNNPELQKMMCEGCKSRTPKLKAEKQAVEAWLAMQEIAKSIKQETTWQAE